MARRSPTLFPQAGNYRREFELREYVEDEMVAMAQAGTLCLTDLMRHPDPLVVELCGQVLLGQEYRDEGLMEKGLDVPPELQSYMVRLKLINDHSKVLWKGTAKSSGRRYGRHSSVATFAAVLHEKEGEGGFVTLPAPKAWLALRFCGKDCRVPRVRRASAQKTLWMCEEVQPVQVPMDDEDTGRRGRRSAQVQA